MLLVNLLHSSMQSSTCAVAAPPSATYAEALKYYETAEKLRPASKTKALIKLVKKKM